jgi:hypothetical protein
MFDPRDPRSIPQMVLTATKPIIILGNGPQIDRMQASFWDRLNAIQQQADSEVVVVGVNRIGIAEACLKHRYKPDIIATVDRPMFRLKTPKDVSAEHAARAAARMEEERTMAPLKRSNPKAYEQWEATRNRLADMELKEVAAKQGVQAEQIPTPVTDAFARSFSSCAGVSDRIVSQQATWFLQPNHIPGRDIVLNLDTSIAGPPDRAKMLFTTADWIVNWFSRFGCREFYFYGVSMREGGHCKTHGLVEDDDYSWSEPGRQHICFKAWDALKDSFPGLRLHNCDRKALFVEKGVMDFQLPSQLDPSYKLLPDSETSARAQAIMGQVAQDVSQKMAVQMKRAKEEAQLTQIKAQMEADKARSIA